MKGKRQRAFSCFLAAMLLISLTGCGRQRAEETLVKMNYGIGVDEVTDNYNTALYCMNGNDVNIADGGCFYLSEEEDPEYGGYFYRYTGNFAAQRLASQVGFKEKGIYDYAVRCLRSKDMYRWEQCGALDGGYVCVVDEEDWPRLNVWAPECIRNPADGKYYLYFNSDVTKDYGVSSVSSTNNDWARMFICVAVSDSPMGPFDILYDIDKATGKRVPTINFHVGMNTAYDWAVIDPSPFFDDDGSFYMYFNKHTDDHYSSLNGMWGVKMISMTHPDYSTVSIITMNGRESATNTPGKGEIEDVTPGAPYTDGGEGGINEGVSMIKHNGKYYATYSRYGYGMPGYSVGQAISDSPLSGFVKLDASKGSPVCDGSIFGNVLGTGHHAMVQMGDDWYIMYARFGSSEGYEQGVGRASSVDRIKFVPNEDGVEVLTACGPSKSLQWLDEDISGYKNLAETADISVSGGTGAEYLNDELIPFYDWTMHRVFKADNDEVTITLSWDKPVSVTSVMVYDARDLANAFSKISDIRFKLAERPKWASKDYDWAVIKDLKLPERYYDLDSETYINCPSAVAEFDPIMVTSIKFTLRGKDKFITEDNMGERNYKIEIPEIAVLGGKEE